jgi:hypothetical protein
VIVTPFLCVFLLYLLMLGMQARSARQASRVLDRVEALRLGDPDSKFFEAVDGCDLSRRYNEVTCVILSGTERSLWVWQAIDRLPLQEEHRFRLLEYTWKGGLRFWSLEVNAEMKDRRISQLKVRFYGVQHQESLGADWRQTLT